MLLSLGALAAAPFGHRYPSPWSAAEVLRVVVWCVLCVLCVLFFFFLSAAWWVMGVAGM
jgi:hypothetical protein